MTISNLSRIYSSHCFMLPSATFLLVGLPGHKAIKILDVLRQLSQIHVTGTICRWRGYVLVFKTSIIQWIIKTFLVKHKVMSVHPSVCAWYKEVSLGSDYYISKWVTIYILCCIYAYRSPLYGGTRWCSYWTHCVTSRKSQIGIFHRLISSGLTLAVGSLSL